MKKFKIEINEDNFINPKTGAELQVVTTTPGEEVEIYLGGYFLCSCEIKDLSNEAYFEVFGKERNDV